LPYDFLVLATGIQYNHFGHEDWRRTAPGLESLDDADLIRGKILLGFERAEEIAALDQADTEKIRQLLTFGASRNEPALRRGNGREMTTGQFSQPVLQGQGAGAIGVKEPDQLVTDGKHAMLVAPKKRLK